MIDNIYMNHVTNFLLCTSCVKIASILDILETSAHFHIMNIVTHIHTNSLTCIVHMPQLNIFHVFYAAYWRTQYNFFREKKKKTPPEHIERNIRTVYAILPNNWCVNTTKKEEQKNRIVLKMVRCAFACDRNRKKERNLIAMPANGDAYENIWFLFCELEQRGIYEILESPCNIYTRIHRF